MARTDEHISKLGQLPGALASRQTSALSAERMHLMMRKDLCELMLHDMMQPLNVIFIALANMGEYVASATQHQNPAYFQRKLETIELQIGKFRTLMEEFKAEIGESTCE